jgi:hypothetical protein
MDGDAEYEILHRQAHRMLERFIKLIPLLAEALYGPKPVEGV